MRDALRALRQRRREDALELKAPHAIVVTFAKRFRALGYVGCTNHSGRRTFVTNAARKISTAGESLRDVQMLTGHSALSTTQHYIEVDATAQRKIVDLIRLEKLD